MLSTRQSVKQAVIQTLAYASVFDFPLLEEEVYRWLIANHPISRSRLSQVLRSSSEFVEVDGFFMLVSMERLAQLRMQRSRWARTLRQEIPRIVQQMSSIPSVTHIYITGSLSMNNPRSNNDDIDILIVTASQTLWLTRLVVIIKSLMVGKYRSHNNHQDGWCFNMWLTHNSLSLPTSKQSLYTAHEVVQAELVFGSENVLLAANPWVVSYLPHIRLPIVSDSAVCSVSALSVVFNRMAYIVQRLYMLPRQTIERVGVEFAFFHPRKTGNHVLQTYHARLRQYGISQDPLTS